VQLLEGYLAAGALHQVARELRLPLSRVDGVASFDHLFRLSPHPPPSPRPLPRWRKKWQVMQTFRLRACSRTS